MKRQNILTLWIFAMLMVAEVLAGVYIAGFTEAKWIALPVIVIAAAAIGWYGMRTLRKVEREMDQDTARLRQQTSNLRKMRPSPPN